MEYACFENIFVWQYFTTASYKACWTIICKRNVKTATTCLVEF